MVMVTLPTGQDSARTEEQQSGGSRDATSVSITVIGGGYVGLVTSACLAQLGHRVVCLEVDDRKVQQLEKMRMPIDEPWLPELWKQNVAAGRLRVTGSYPKALESCEVIFIAVGTPSAKDGSADLQYVESAVRTAARMDSPARVICMKSTVPPGTCARLQDELERNPFQVKDWAVVSNPEFLSQGSAVTDFMQPDRLVIGTDDRPARELVRSLYAGLDAPVVYASSTEAELIKYASNSFLALKISFINEISHLCEYSGADVGPVANGVGLDRRIGPSFLQAGLGWGGSCFPKDTAALASFMRRNGLNPVVVQAARDVNNQQIDWVMGRLRELLGASGARSVAVWGLTFKPGTDDIRGSQSVPLIRALINEGYSVTAHDPARPQLSEDLRERITVAKTPEEAAQNADALILATEWPLYLKLDFESVRDKMATPLILDTRRALKPETLSSLGFEYYRLGDGRSVPARLKNNSRSPLRALPAHPLATSYRRQVAA